MNLQERGRAVLEEREGGPYWRGREREGHIGGKVEGGKGWEKCCHLSYNLKKKQKG